MKFCLRLALLLLLVIGTLTQDGFDLSDALDDLPKEKPKVTEKPKTDGFDLSDALDGFDLSDALDDLPKEKPKVTEKPKTDDHFGFTLEDALRPAVKPTGKSGAGDCQESVLQKLGTIIDNQNQQLRLLLQMMARLPASSRFSEKSMR